jgi:hypothetical protein
MHAGIDAYGAIAEQHEHDENRSQAMRDALFEYYVEQLEEHGYHGDRGQVASVMGIDVELNGQGLEVWLERRKR